MLAPTPHRKFLTKRAVAQRYSVTPRTVERWAQTGALRPADQTINNRPYWSEDGLDADDRQRTIDAARHPAPKTAA